MSEKTKTTGDSKKPSSTRQITKGVIGGLEFGFVLYLCFLFFRVAINAVAGTPIIPTSTELGGFAIGFAGGIVKDL